ncbi:MAG: ABC transporter ATP-binding protein/permease [Clostridiales bacterium]|nr:ABC transporter ATP-binding protein/permease [Clostridiales bacterium]
MKRPPFVFPSVDLVEDPRPRFSYPDDDPVEKPFNWQQMRRLLGYLKPYQKTVGLALFITLVAMGTRLALPYLLGLAIDRAILQKNLSLLHLYALGYLALQVIYWGASFVRIRLTNRMGQDVLRDLRRQLFHHVQRLSFDFFDGQPAGRILVRLTNDVNALNELISNALVNTLGDIFLLLGILAMLFYLQPHLALASLVVLPLLMWASTGLRLRIRRAWQAVRIRLSAINSHLNEALQGMRVTQAFRQEEANSFFFRGLISRYYRAYMKATQENAQFGPLVELAGALGTAVVVLYGVYLLRHGQMEVGTLVAFITYVGNFWEPISRLGQVYSLLLVAMASSERIFEILDTPPSIPVTVVGERPAPVIRGEVEFDRVSFSYGRGRGLALKDVSFRVEPGQTVALVGHTGAGKTTIVQLIGRFYDVTSGCIRIDGTDIRQYDLAALRSQVAYVLQETFLFQGTIRDNIRYGRLDASDEEVEEAARAVHFHRFVERLPHGYDTYVQERGSRLSAGERQLLSFARAILADPRILILDEATSAIDTETEMLVQDALRVLLKGRTSFVVAHRLSTVRQADLILVLKDGEIVERGDHATLAGREGYYAQLLQAQRRFFLQEG